MFLSGMSPYSGFAFSVLTMSIGVPSAIKTFNWIGTLWGGKIQFKSPMLFALGFVSLFVSGGLSGLFLAQPAVDNMLTPPTTWSRTFIWSWEWRPSLEFSPPPISGSRKCSAA